MNQRYTWKKNGVNLNISANNDRIVQLAGKGSIAMVMNAHGDNDDGVYQCTATNPFGVSVSKLVNLR
jgi:hypothetical protein